MEFSGSVLTPGQMNKAGTKAMPGKLLCLSKSFFRTDHIPMDLTVSTPKTWISFGDSCSSFVGCQNLGMFWKNLDFPLPS